MLRGEVLCDIFGFIRDASELNVIALAWKSNSSESSRSVIRYYDTEFLEQIAS